MCALSLGARLLAVTLVVAATAVPASGHRTTSGSTDGIAIPSLTHGQMAVLDNNRAAILALAERQPKPEARFRRILNYARIQRTVCLWGLMPGAIDDDASPFNECAHAYLAATRALLDAMSEAATPGAAPLAAKVDRELLLDGTLVACGFSAETFNTADLVQPHWREFFGHPPSLAVVASLTLAGLGAGMLTLRRRRPKASGGP